MHAVVPFKYQSAPPIPAHLLPQLAAAFRLAALGHNAAVGACHLPSDGQPNRVALLQQRGMCDQ